MNLSLNILRYQGREKERVSLEPGRDHLEVRLLSSGCSGAPSERQTLLGAEPQPDAGCPSYYCRTPLPCPIRLIPLEDAGLRRSWDQGLQRFSRVTLFSLCGFSPRVQNHVPLSTAVFISLLRCLWFHGPLFGHPEASAEFTGERAA